MNASILEGDCLAVLATLPADSFQACVTSPPYYGLRDYGVDGQIGREETPDAYAEKMVEVFRQVRRVLHPTGTLWLNLGDSYASNGGPASQGMHGELHGRAITEAREGMRRGLPPGGFKPKDLLGMPWMIAFALRADGWWLRQEIIWHKPNPMPESVRDRCTRAHEHIFLLTKSPRYYFDQSAILEPASPNTHARLAQDVQAQVGSLRANGGTRPDRPMKAVSRKFDPAGGNKNNASFDAAMAIMPTERNKRSVWTVPTQGFKGAHFATFPPDLIEPSIRAGSRPGDQVLDPFGGAGTTGIVASAPAAAWRWARDCTASRTTEDRESERDLSELQRRARCDGGRRGTCADLRKAAQPGAGLRHRRGDRRRRQREADARTGCEGGARRRDRPLRAEDEGAGAAHGHERHHTHRGAAPEARQHRLRAGAQRCLRRSPRARPVACDAGGHRDRAVPRRALQRSHERRPALQRRPAQPARRRSAGRLGLHPRRAAGGPVPRRGRGIRRRPGHTREAADGRRLDDARSAARRGDPPALRTDRLGGICAHPHRRPGAAGDRAPRPAEPERLGVARRPAACDRGPDDQAAPAERGALPLARRGIPPRRPLRRATLIELNPEYAAMARERCRADAPLLAMEGTAA